MIQEFQLKFSAVVGNRGKVLENFADTFSYEGVVGISLDFN